jgi:peptide/nickel transport system substrate-binding protein
MDDWTCKLAVGKANNWNNDNAERYCNPDYDKIVDQIRAEPDPAKAATLVIQANDFLVADVGVIPIVNRTSATVGVAKSMKNVVLTGWDSEMWDVANWSK